MSEQPTYIEAICRMKAAETALAEAQAELVGLRSTADFLLRMGRWMATRVPELGAAAQSAVLREEGFTAPVKHEGLTFGHAYGGWRAICSCGWVGDEAPSIGASRIDHQLHVEEEWRKTQSTPARSGDVSGAGES